MYALKPWFVGRLRSCEEVLVARRVSPNTITLAAILASVMAGGVIAGGATFDRPLLWLAVLPLGVMRLALNALDGSVARRLRMSSPRGAVLNELGDRACDLAVFAALVTVAPAWMVVTGIAAVTLTSTAGVMALAITGTRDTGGPMGKADRVVVLGLAGLVAAAIDSQTPFILAIGAVICGCAITTWLRVSRISTEMPDVRQ
ncbi:MAG TPA: CDP-alcohol phosphatidyltransferase family protein [Actinomycetota bacterium]|nr:CDP-alcohol phosphatidyltransferase family protein [Actinomycetota bacterium]